MGVFMGKRPQLLAQTIIIAFNWARQYWGGRRKCRVQQRAYKLCKLSSAWLINVLFLHCGMVPRLRAAVVVMVMMLCNNRYSIVGKDPSFLPTHTNTLVNTFYSVACRWLRLKIRVRKPLPINQWHCELGKSECQNLCCPGSSRCSSVVQPSACTKCRECANLYGQKCQ